MVSHKNRTGLQDIPRRLEVEARHNSNIRCSLIKRIQIKLACISSTSILGNKHVDLEFIRYGVLARRRNRGNLIGTEGREREY
jgi:hypothetical protein